MNWITKKEHSEKHQQLLHDARMILETAGKEKRSMTPEEDKQWSDLHNEAEAVAKMVQAHDAQDASERALEQRLETADREGQNKPEVKDAAENYRKAFRNWLTRGERLSGEDRRTLENVPAEYRTASGLDTVTSAHGLQWAPTVFATYVTDALKATGGIRENATVLVQDSAAKLTFPTCDDTANTGSFTTQASEVTDDDTYDPTTGNVEVTPQVCNSKIIRISVQLLNSASFDVEQYVAGKLADRIGRASNTAFTVGSGTGEPKGLIPAASVGVTTASATAFTYNELLDLKHSVNSAYRSRGNCRWMFNDATLKYIKQNLVDDNHRPLWNGGNIDLQLPPTIDSDPYIINDDVASIGSTNKSVAYGDFKGYTIVDVNSLVMVRFNENYMKYLQFGFMAWLYTGGNLVDLKSVKVLQHHVS